MDENEFHTVDGILNRIESYTTRVEQHVIAWGLQVIVGAWSSNPDAFGDNEKDYRNTLRDIMDALRQESEAQRRIE